MTMPVTAQPRVFHGWKVLGLCTFCQFVSMGFTLYLIGVFIEPLAEVFSASHGQIGSASAIFTVTGAILGPVLGYGADRDKTRLIMLWGGLLMAIGLVLLSQAGTLLQAALVCMFILAPGAAMLGTISTTVMVAQWFKKRRGFAIGVTAAGISAGGFIMPPLVAWLLGTIGPRGSLLALGVTISLVLLPTIWRVAVVKPADIGQAPDGVERPPVHNETAEALTPPLNLTAILSRSDFWLISVAVGVLSFFGVLIITYLTPYAKEAGMTLQEGALILSLYAISGIAGKFTCGWLCDLVPPRRLLGATMAMAAIGWLPILFFDTVLAFSASAFSVGFAMGALIPVWSTLIALNFGLASFGRVRGVMSLILVGFTVLPGPLGGYIYDTTGSYTTAFGTLWPVMPAAVLVSLFIRRPPVQTV